MVYTITFNPALDYVMKTEKLIAGKVNRSSSEYLVAGGKGINVSMLLTELSVENTALGFVGGFTGEKIKTILEEKGINCDFVEIDGESRINVKIKADEEIELNAKGPEISENEVEELLNKIEKTNENDIIVLSGSVPNGVGEDIYCKIAQKVKGKIIVDAEKNLLLDTLKYKPFLVKPNHIELGEMFDADITTPDDAIEYAKKLVLMGAENVVVSMAEKGGVFVNKKDAFYMEAPKGKVINSTGAGDSLVAGFIAEYVASGNVEKAFRMGVICGSASAFSENLATSDDINKLEKMLISDSE